MKINISIPISIDENDLYLYDPNSDFYNDPCYAYTSKNGTDVSLEDRKKEYIENNMTLCEENCKFKRYDTYTKRALCECNIKINFFMISEITIDKAKLYDNFINLKTVTNLWVMKCYDILLSKKGIINNIGAYIIIIIIILHIIFIILFYVKDFPSIKMNINSIIFKKKDITITNTKPFLKTQKIRNKKKSKFSK